MFTKKEIKELIFNAIKKSEKFLAEESPQNAEIILSQLLKINPDNFKAIQLLGMSQYKQNKYEEAKNTFKIALKSSPNNAENHNNIGLCYADLREFNKAIEHAKKSINLNPNELIDRSKKYDVNKPYVNYLDKDFLSLKKDLINYAKSYF